MNMATKQHMAMAAKIEIQNALSIYEGKVEYLSKADNIDTRMEDLIRDAAKSEDRSYGMMFAYIQIGILNSKEYGEFLTKHNQIGRKHESILNLINLARKQNKSKVSEVERMFDTLKNKEIAV